MDWIWELDSANCPGCGICADVCEYEALRMTVEMAWPVAIPGLCQGCLTCEAECPCEAIAVRVGEAVDQAQRGVFS